jgi:hypothetical protein
MSKDPPVILKNAFPKFDFIAKFIHTRYPFFVLHHICDPLMACFLLKTNNSNRLKSIFNGIYFALIIMIIRLTD